MSAARRWAPRALSLRAKLALLALLPLLASLLLIAFAVRQQESELAAREHALVRASYMDARRTELKHYVDLAVSTIKPLLGQPGGQDRALAILQSLDYGPDGYFFLYHFDGTNLMHPRQPDLVGKNWLKLRDAYGRNLFGQGCLLARRLVEKGVRFVQIFDWGWDSHGTDADLAIEAARRAFDQGAPHVVHRPLDRPRVVAPARRAIKHCLRGHA